jgi:diamine N-acetyltransferase
MRLVIEAVEAERPVGVIDLFDFDPYHLRAGVGILIHESRRAGYATGALTLLVRYGFEVLGLHQFYCDIPATNIASQRLFERCGFTRCGQKRHWLKKPNGWEDVYVYQLIR